VQANNGVFYLLGDHLGSTNLVVDEDGVKVAEMRYKAWGETRYMSAAPGTDYRYTDSERRPASASTTTARDGTTLRLGGSPRRIRSFRVEARWLGTGMRTD
jgi:hypothetical protein